MSKEPTIKIESKISTLKLTGWENERGMSWNFNKRYKDKETGEWRESKYLTDWDLDAIVSLAAQAKEFLSQRRRAKNEYNESAAVGVRPNTEAPVKLQDDDIPF